MKHDIRLQPHIVGELRCEKPIHFTWDDETGEMAGPDGKYLRDYIIGPPSDKVSYIGVHPVPSSYKITNPYLHPEQLGAILYNYWKIVPPLKYPKIDPGPRYWETEDKDGNIVREEIVY